MAEAGLYRVDGAEDELVDCVDYVVEECLWDVSLVSFAQEKCSILVVCIGSAQSVRQ